MDRYRIARLMVLSGAVFALVPEAHGTPGSSAGAMGTKAQPSKPVAATAVVPVGSQACSTLGPASEMGEDAYARKLSDGEAAFKAKKYEVAKEIAKESYRLYPTFSAKDLAARSLVMLGRRADAYNQYMAIAQGISEQIKNAAPGQDTTANEELRSTAYLEMAKLENQIARLILRVPSDAPDFTVTLDGKLLPADRWGVAEPVDPGPHEVVATGTRLQPFVEKFTVVAGEIHPLPIRPIRLETATVRVSFANRPPGMSIVVDDRPTPVERSDDPIYFNPGKHKIQIHAPGHRSFEWSKDLKDGEKVPITATLVPSTGTPRWLFFTMAAATVGTFGVGIGYGIVAQQKQSEVSPDGKLPSQLSVSQRDEIKGLATSANICFGVGGALALSSAILAFTTEWRTTYSGEKATRPVVTAMLPLVGPGISGLAVLGEF